MQHAAVAPARHTFLTSCTTSSSKSTCSLPTFCGECFTDEPQTSAYLKFGTARSQMRQSRPSTRRAFKWLRARRKAPCKLRSATEICYGKRERRLASCDWDAQMQPVAKVLDLPGPETVVLRR